MAPSRPSRDGPLTAPIRSSRDGLATEMTSSSSLRRSKTDTISTHYLVDKRRRNRLFIALYFLFLFFDYFLFIHTRTIYSITNDHKYRLIRAISLDSSEDYEKFSKYQRELEFLLPVTIYDPSRRQRCTSTGMCISVNNHSSLTHSFIN